jgi:hypothetical protein
MFLAALGASARGGKFAMGLDLSFKMQGEHALAWDWKTMYNNENAPSGNPETRAALIVNLEYRMLPGFTIGGHAGETMLFDAGHIRGEKQYGFEAGFGVRFHY